MHIMGNEQAGEPDLSLDPEDQFQDLFPRGRIQRGNRFVADHHFRFCDQRPGNADALTLPAGKGMGIPVCIAVRQPGQGKDLPDPLLFFLICQTMPGRSSIYRATPGKSRRRVQRLRERLAHGQAGIQRCIGILEHHLDFSAK